MTTYNGWTNYATWRVNLVCLESLSDSDFASTNTYELSKEIQARIESYVDESSPDGLAKDYALAFLADVNWYEIAEAMIKAALWETWND